MIRDKYGCVWAGHADLARDWGGDVTAVVWGGGHARQLPLDTHARRGRDVPCLDPPAPQSAGMTSSTCYGGRF